jgi:RNA polymerase sigma-54 factor
MLKQQLQSKTTHSLTMSKNMQQSLHILKMNVVELQDFVSTALENNPFLEYTPDPNNKTLDDVSESEGYENDSPGALRYHQLSSHASSMPDRLDHVENRVNLYTLIEEQINAACLNHVERMIAKHLTTLLDENGYMRESIDEIAQFLKCSVPQISKVLKVLQSFEPSGIFACSLKECIAIQLKDLDIADPNTLKVLEYLDEATSHQKLQQKLKLSSRQINEALTKIKRTNPRPANSVSYDYTHTKIVDAVIKALPDGQLIVRLNHDAIPSIATNDVYFNVICKQIHRSEERKFCLTQWKNATFLTKAIAQRLQTILRVLQHIVTVQRDFFHNGIAYLKPMTLVDVASALNLHESTISRINNKIVSTPFGTYEIKYFFSGAIKSNVFEEDLSATSVKHQIKQLIDTEQHPLSDDEITTLLQNQGVQISRRTVAKYRGILRIPSSHLRKKASV